MLRGLEPGSTSYDYDERVSSWTSATFKVQGMLPNGLVDNIWRPIRLFTLGPDSFGAPALYAHYPDDSGMGLALCNRMLRAAAYQVEDV